MPLRSKLLDDLLSVLCWLIYTYLCIDKADQNRCALNKRITK